jgi:uncharacterized protein (DUF1919 family)
MERSQLRLLAKSYIRFISAYSLRKNLAKWVLNKRVKDKQFTIISNNCWGAPIYTELGLPYMTPFVGLYVNAPCYLKLLKNLKPYLESPLVFTETSRYEVYNEKKKAGEWSYPIGLLKEDVEIHFIHYSSPLEALEKWNRRLKRVKWDNLFIKFCDTQPFSENFLLDFDQLPFRNKVCFTAKNYPDIKSTVWIKECNDSSSVVTGFKLYWTCKRYFDIADWLNGENNDILPINRLLNEFLYTPFFIQ